MLLNLLAALPVAIWTYLLTSRAGYWRMRKHLLPESHAPAPPSKIVAVVPARNEGDVVARSVTSLLTQDLPAPLEVVLVDDGSSDGTAEAARRAAEIIGLAHRLEVLPSLPLPSGWTGKLWAVFQGIERASHSRPDYFLLTDADIEHAPGTIGRLLSVAAAGDVDLASVMVRLATSTLAERLLIPAFVYFFLQLYPPGWISRSERSSAGAAGGCMLIRADTLSSLGGIRAIAGEVIDDCALAALVKRQNGRVWLGLSDQTISLRSYGGFAGVGKMISRSAFNQLRHSTLLLSLTLAGLLTTYLLPVVLVSSGLFGRKKMRVAFGGAACGLMAVTYAPAVKLYRQPTVTVLALPLVALFYAGATLHSAIRYWSGVGGEWKGRIQDQRR